MIFATNIRGPKHEAQPKQKPRHGSRGEKRVDTRLCEPRVKNEGDARWNNGSQGAARRDRRAAKGPVVTGSGHLRDGDHPDARGASRRRSRHSRHHDASDNGRIGKSAPQMTEADTSEAEKAFRDAANAHEVAHQEEKRD